jgi:hypothetical protein
MLRRTAVSNLIVGAMVVSACAGSSEGSGTTAVRSTDAPEPTGDLFEPSDSGGEPAATQTDEAESADSEPSGPQDTESPGDDGSTGGESADDDQGDDDQGDDGQGEVGQTDDEALELFPSDEVDDVPFCQAYAEYFEVFVGIAFAASFAEFDPEGGDDFQPELLEVFLYPAVVDDVEVIRETAPPEVLEFFEPLFERAERAVPALEDAGFTQTEIEVIRADEASADNAADIAADFEGDPRIDVAVESFVAENGALIDSLDVLDGDGAGDPDADVADAYFRETCPELSSALDQL